MYLFRGEHPFDALLREVEANKPDNIFVQRGWGV